MGYEKIEKISLSVSCFLACGLMTEQRPKSVPKNGRKLVVFSASSTEPNLGSAVLSGRTKTASLHLYL